MQNKYQISQENLSLDIASFDDEEYSSNELSYAEKNNDVLNEIKAYINKTTELSAKEIMDKMFPITKPHLFISHKSEYAGTAIKLANILYDKYHIISFIDSQVWHHIDDIGREINNKLSKLKENNGVITYKHTRANAVASHLFAMLSSSLFKVMDESDGFIYIDSSAMANESKIGRESIDELQTKSPWLYLETTYASMLRKKMHKRPSEEQKRQYTFDSVVANESLKHKTDTNIVFNYTQEIIDSKSIISLGKSLFLYDGRKHPLVYLDAIYSELDKNVIPDSNLG